MLKMSTILDALNIGSGRKKLSQSVCRKNLQNSNFCIFVHGELSPEIVTDLLN